MPSSITINVTSLPTANVDIIFYKADPVLALVQQNFKVNRTQTRDVPVATSLGQQSLFIQQFFAQDFNQFSFFTFEFPTGTSVKITHKTEENYFDTASLVGGWGTITTESTPNPVTPELQSATYTDIDCVNVSASLLFNIGLTSLNINNTIYSNPVPNPQTITLGRGQTFAYTANNSGESITGTLNTPNIWNLTSVDQSVTANGFFIEMQVTETGSNPNTYEYSIDGTNYQASNSFLGLAEGSYTAYVRDQYGCNQQANFNVQTDPFSTVNTDIIEFPLLNSFHFIENLTKDGCTVYSNEMNTLSKDESIHNNKRFFHLVQTCDCITTQFRSNYDTNEVTLFGCDGLELPIPVVKQSNNINLFDTRDFVTTSIDGKLGFYINGGNIYETQTLAIIGQNTIVNDVFTYQNIGDVVNIQDYGYLSIKDITFIDEINAWVAITDFDFSGSNEFKRITTNYNLKDYDVYEFEINFQNLIGYYFLGFCATNDNGTREFITEFINVQDIHENTHEIIYRNTVNKVIDYRTGITHTIRLPYVIKNIYTPSDENEIYTKDTDVVLLDSDVFDSETFEFSPIPKAIAKKLNEALSTDTLYIDRLQYIRENTPNIENIGGGNNLYNFNINLRRAAGDIQGLSKLEVELEVLKFSNASSFFIGETNSSGFIALDNNNSGFIALSDTEDGFIKLQ